MGVLSYLHSKGNWGPYLIIVSHTASLAAWAADLQQLLSGSILVHTHDGSPASREATARLCHGPQPCTHPQGSPGGRTRLVSSCAPCSPSTVRMGVERCREKNCGWLG